MSRISVGFTTVYFIIILLLISTGSIVHEALAFKLTASSYEDGVTRGMNDAQCDSNQCHGHGYDASCPSGHTNTFCRGYAKGYSEGWGQQSGSGTPNEQIARGSGGTEDQNSEGSNLNSDNSGGDIGSSKSFGERHSTLCGVGRLLLDGTGHVLLGEGLHALCSK